uniref:acyltransferase Pun1-like n=1 Tax=Erigeron canadensis TaxID=72917 RepID=UPI001CB8B9D1|nr:acyltransferase Pun1-like [Erigeron canadensis]
MVFFYKNSNKLYGDIINTLKKSLSQCLTQYYPFAGRLLLPDHVDCNDAGVEFLEASIDSRLDEYFVVKKLEKDDDDTLLGQLLPYSRLGLAVNSSTTNSSIAEIQLTHFTCGGVALGVSIAHKVADGFTAVNFMNHWAAVTRGETPPVKLSFSSSPSSSHIFSYKDIITDPEQQVGVVPVKYVTRRLLFPNSKLNELKNKVLSIVNPTRVDSLTSLIFKCAMGAATAKSGSSSQPSNLMQPVNLRGSIFPKLGAGNMIGLANARINADSGEIKLNDVVTSLRKERRELQGVKDVEEIGKKWSNILLTIGDGRSSRTYFTTSICGFPVYQVDFGWGNPVRAMLRVGNEDASIFMDTPSGDGIEATVCLEQEEMDIFQHDQQLLEYTQQNI